MGALMLKCPTTDREFSMGMNIDEDNFRKLPDTVTRARCPHCGLTHAWWTHEARWVPGMPRRWEAYDRAS
jgi:hypothetical protein